MPAFKRVINQVKNYSDVVVCLRECCWDSQDSQIRHLKRDPNETKPYMKGMKS